MADTSLVGERGTPREMLVERSKIREFATACMTDNPAYLDDHEPVSEPTFLTTKNFWGRGGDSPVSRLGIDFRRLLHGGDEFTFHGPPPRAGTVLTFTTRIADAYEKEGKRGGTMTFYELVTEFVDESGTLVAEEKTTMIITGKATTD